MCNKGYFEAQKGTIPYFYNVSCQSKWPTQFIERERSHKSRANVKVYVFPQIFFNVINWTPPISLFKGMWNSTVSAEAQKIFRAVVLQVRVDIISVWNQCESGQRPKSFMYAHNSHKSSFATTWVAAVGCNKMKCGDTQGWYFAASFIPCYPLMPTFTITDDAHLIVLTWPRCTSQWVSEFH